MIVDGEGVVLLVGVFVFNLSDLRVEVFDGLDEAANVGLFGEFEG